MKIPIGVFAWPSWVSGAMPSRTDERGDAGPDRLPSGGGALEDVDLGRRTARSHNGNDLGRVADLRGEPRCVIGVAARARKPLRAPKHASRTADTSQSAHAPMVAHDQVVTRSRRLIPLGSWRHAISCENHRACGA